MGAFRVELGQVVGAFGIRGELRVKLFGDDARHLGTTERVSLASEASDPRAKTYAVIALQAGRAGEARLKLEGVESREAAEAKTGLLVCCDPGVLESLPRGEYYWYELIGCTVWESTGERLGVLRSLLATGAHDVFVVEGEAGDELLLPAAESLIREIDPVAKRIVVEVPEGIALTRSGGADETSGGND